MITVDRSSVESLKIKVGNANIFFTSCFYVHILAIYTTTVIVHSLKGMFFLALSW